MLGCATDEDTLNRNRDLSFKLTVIARQLRNRFDQRVAKLGITRSQWALVAVVMHHPGATQRTIAEKLEISEAAAGRLIDRLCADGFLERQPRADDRRAYSVCLTPQAQPHLSILGDIASENDELAYAGLSETELDQLSAILDTIYGNVTR